MTNPISSKARNYWVDDPKSANADWLKLVLRLRTLEGLKAGRFVTIDGRVVFIGGPGAGGGGSASSGAGHALGIVPERDIESAGKVQQLLEAGIPGGAFTYEQIGQVKNAVVSDISELSGESYEDVNAVVGQWAKSSNDNDIRSLALQRDASEEFGIPLSDFTQKNIDAIEEQRATVSAAMATGMSAIEYERYIDKYLPSSAPLLPSNQQRRILRAMYDNTQIKLSEAGFQPGDRIRLYRGVSDVGEHRIGDVINIQSNTLSSWSSDLEIATTFAFEGKGIVFSMDVPIEMIMGSAVSGFGCYEESEFVLLGLPSTAAVVDTYI